MSEKTFDELWKWINARGSIVTVQEKHELEHVFNLMKGCNCQSYLEIGTAEGNSLYVLGHALSSQGIINYVDFGEKHTEQARRDAIAELNKYNKTNLWGYMGDSTSYEIYRSIDSREHDCILIDGGHDFATVLSDSILYAPLATKYVFWHDIQLPEVRAAYEWFKKRWKIGEYSEFINSDTFGFGICKII